MGKEIKELECVFSYIGHRRRRQTSVNLQIHWHDTDSDYQMCCPQLSAIHGKDCRRTCVGRSRYGVESCAVTKKRSKTTFLNAFERDTHQHLPIHQSDRMVGENIPVIPPDHIEKLHSPSTCTLEILRSSTRSMGRKHKTCSTWEVLP